MLGDNQNTSEGPAGDNRASHEPLKAGGVSSLIGSANARMIEGEGCGHSDGLVSRYSALVSVFFVGLG